VGDSRIYRLHAQALEQLTDDHRVRLSSTESYLGRALGTGPHVEIDYRSWEAEPGEIYLLATDGAYTHLDAPCTTPWPATRATSTPPPRGSPTGPGPRQQRRRDPAAPAHRRPARARRPHPQLRRDGLALPPPLAPRAEFEGFTIVRELQQSARSHVWPPTRPPAGRWC
jgi:hypothetical protein